MQVDLIIKNASVYNSFAKKFIPNHVVVKGNKFLYIGQNITEFEAVETLDLAGKYLVPGLIDVHMHIESTMATPRAFAHELARHGVTTIISEPHEIANTYGLAGVQAMLEASEGALIDVFLGVPSSVPSTSTALETTGGEISLSDLEILMAHPKVVCLGEVMNYVDVIYKEHSKTLDFIKYTQEKYPYIAIEGHCPRIADVELAKMLYAGVESDHTQQSASGIVDRFLQGMFVEIQSKSLKAEIIDLVRQYNMYERVALVTDDIMADELVSKGQLDKNLRKLIQLGMPPELAIYISTYTPAKHIGWRDRGCIAAGRLADFFVTDDLKALPIQATYKNGQCIYHMDKPHEFVREERLFPDEFRHSIKRGLVSAQDLIIKVSGDRDSVTCNAFALVEDATFTKAELAEINVHDGLLNWQTSEYALVVCLERYGHSSNIAFGLARGACLQQGAVATSYAHDHHNILAIGRNIDDLVLAINRVIAEQGAYTAYLNGECLACVQLPIAGILSPLTMPELAQAVEELKRAFAQLNYNHKNPIMSLSTLSLPVSPELKITDKGLVKVAEQKIVPLIVD